MAQILLHGTLHVTILEADELAHPGRASGGAPNFFRKVFDFSRCFFFFFSFNAVQSDVIFIF